MKVGILTLPLWHNYGGILQAYALRQAVADLGHEATLLDVQRPAPGPASMAFGRVKRRLRRLVRGAGNAPWYADRRELREISHHTRAFVEAYIQPRSAHVPITTAMGMTGQFDALIVGSDQVWRREYMPDLSAYFLISAQGHARRISYAASLGVDDWRFTPPESTLFADGLARFHSVSVREDSGRELLKRELGVKAERVCDPTMLLDVSHYCRLAGVAPRAAGNIVRVFTYVLDSGSQQMTQLSDVVGHLGGEAFNVMPQPFGPAYHRDKASYVFGRVETWLKAFNDCDFVITDSFHGCVFSLIFNRPFVAVANLERGATRFKSLLGRYDLLDRLFSSVEQIDPTALAPIDWGNVNGILATERAAGTAFLRDALA